MVIPAETLAHGALLILPSRCVAVWRQPGSGQVRTRAVELDAETSVALSAVTVDSEIWVRFDVMRPGPVSYTHLDVYKRQGRVRSVAVEEVLGVDEDAAALAGQELDMSLIHI